MSLVPDPSLSSFRDPDGNVFLKDGLVHRKINLSYKNNYDKLMNSGLYDALIKENLIISHKEVEVSATESNLVYKIILPDQIKFISYPYEWSFNQLKDAALSLIRIQKIAFNFGMVLKDASAFNMQWHNGRPVLIDTMSFEIYSENKPWIAYRQFCQHFLAPLALMSYCDLRTNVLLKDFIDGIPLDMTKSLLPKRSKLNFSILLHIHLHAKSLSKGNNVKTNKSKKFSKLSFKGLMDSLERGVQKLQFKKSTSNWNNYYDETILSKEYLLSKQKLVADFFSITKGKYTWDLGANTGLFSRIALNAGSHVISFDNDALAVDENYLSTKSTKENNLLPLVMDLTNPSAAIGWNNEERFSLLQRPKPTCVMALALVHHLAIANNLPLEKLANFFGSLSEWLIIEFIPKEDPKVIEMLAYRKDIFDDYKIEKFEDEFCKEFKIVNKSLISNSSRTLYLMQKIK